MTKIKSSQILVKGAKLMGRKLSASPRIISLIDETKRKQIEILKLKEVDQERLRTVVQL
jgi:hypothetical protein